MSNVLNTAFFLPIGFRGVVREAAEAALIQDLICYDQVWILSDQMSAVGMLAGILGFDALERAIDNGSIRFLHDRFMIGWPDHPGYASPTPTLSIMSLPRASGGPGFSNVSATDLARHALDGFDADPRQKQRVADLAGATSLDYNFPPNQNEEASADQGRASLLRELDRSGQAVLGLDDFPVKLADINRLRRDVANPRKNWLLMPKRIAVVRTTLRQGSALLEATAPVSQRQLGMINLALADRFLLALTDVPAPTVVHTEPIVEDILRAYAESIRFASGREIEDILRWEEVAFPVLIDSATELSYDLLVRARESPAGRNFRRVVADRDVASTRTLASVYRESLASTTSAKWGVQVARWVGLKALDLGARALGLPSVGSNIGIRSIDQVIGKLLERRDARYHIDTQLRRVASRTEAMQIIVRP